MSLSLSTTDIIAVSAIIVAVSVVAGFALYKRAQLKSIEKQTELLKAKTEALKLSQQQGIYASAKAECKYCKSAVEIGTVFCPVCRRSLR